MRIQAVQLTVLAGAFVILEDRRAYFARDCAPDLIFTFIDFDPWTQVVKT